MWKCSVGQPIEFRGTYRWAMYHANTMLKFSWVGQTNIAIGKGFSVSPKLMHTYSSVPAGYPVKNPSLPSDLNLVVTGPGLSPTGKEVKPSWGSGSCLSGGKKHCRHFMNVEVLQAWSLPKMFTVEFISGYSEQEYGNNGWNNAYWRICLGGPFEHVTLKAASTPWNRLKELLNTATSGWAINNIEECGEATSCEFTIQPSLDEITEAIRQFAEAQVPKPYQRLQRESHERLEHIQTALREVDPLIKRSNDVDSATDRGGLRAAAIEQLKKAHELQESVIALLERLDQVLPTGDE